MAYILNMVIVETQVFTKLITDLLPDEKYRELQNALLAYPEAGDVIEGGVGLRKLRWGTEHTGKRGGLRIIYFWVPEDQKLFLVTVYKKSRQEDLTPDQLKTLAKWVKERLK